GQGSCRQPSLSFFLGLTHEKSFFDGEYHLLASLSSLLFPVQSMISTDLNLFHKNETSQFHLLVNHLINKANSHNGPNVHDLKIQHPPYECLGHINMDE